MSLQSRRLKVRNALFRALAQDVRDAMFLGVSNGTDLATDRGVFLTIHVAMNAWFLCQAYLRQDVQRIILTVGEPWAGTIGTRG